MFKKLKRKLLGGFWRQQRWFDLAVLWPACIENTPDLDIAKAVFAQHAFNDPAWIEWYGADGLIEFIDKLEAGND